MSLLMTEVQEVQYFDVYKLSTLNKAKPNRCEKWLTM